MGENIWTSVIYPCTTPITFIIFILVTGQRFPTISYISQEKVIDIGGSIELECSVQYVRDFPVLWIKMDNVDPSRTIPLSTGSNLIVKDSRFSLRYDQASSTYTLQVGTILMKPLFHFCWYTITCFLEMLRSRTFKKMMLENTSVKYC